MADATHRARKAEESDAPPAKRRRRRNSRRRRSEVLETAAQVFFEKGYDAASIKDIAARLGIEKGSVYYYISTKEDVLFELIDSYHQETRAYFEPFLTSNESVLDKLRRFIALETAHTAGNLIKSSLFYTQWRALPRERQASIIRERDRHDRFVEDCIREGQKASLIRPEIDPKLARNGILGMVNSVYRWYRPDGRKSATEIGESFADLIVGGLATRS